MAKKDEVWYFKYLRREINRIWQWCPERKKARTRALIQKSPVEIFRCELCHAQPLGRKDVQIDHIIERESLTGWDGWDSYINRTYCDANGLQVLCKSCHSKKTAKGNAERRKARKNHEGI